MGILLYLLTFILSGQAADSCTTIGGPRNNTPCVFPFYWDAKKYEDCGLVKDDFWCSTQTDTSGNHIYGIGQWGICPDKGCFPKADTYPDVLEISSSGDANSLYPQLMGDYNKIPKKFKNGRPVWKHKTTNAEFFFDYFINGNYWLVKNDRIKIKIKGNLTVTTTTSTTTTTTPATIQPISVKPSDEESSSSPTEGNSTPIPIVAAVAGVFVVGAAACGIFFLIRRRRRSMRVDPPAAEPLEAPLETMPPSLPPHTVLMKDFSLKEQTKKLAGRKEELEEEFSRMEDWVKRQVKEPSTVAMLEQNKAHNRYTDIVPFDGTHLSLSSPLFHPPETSYVNASRIVFPACSQAFIASQAPKIVSFNHFWHMVIQEKVSVVVMITRLVEGKKKKADQYWPDDLGQGEVKDLDGGCNVEHISTSYQGSYFLRKFLIHLHDSTSQEVTQLHTENWPDLAAPEDPRVLVDLVFRAEELLQRSPGCLLVHCSAGVGRTGTFLALFKLWTDYQDSSCPSLAILPTVVTMRKQRCLMVQKAVQYVYIAQCLSHMVGIEEGNYYEA